MSNPTITVRLPMKAKLHAKLALVNDLPSPLVVDVKRMTFWSVFNIYCTLVRIERYTSSIMPFLFS